jgi:CRISPR-associated protein Csc2
MTTIQELFQLIPERFFVKSLKENKIGHIKLAFVREVINPLIIRSTDPEATITMFTTDERELAEVPARKFKSREKLLGLMICREFGVVDENVRYNSIFDSKHLANPNSVLFGDSVTQSQDAASLTSRAIYDWAYSLRDVKDITDKLQHNAMSEDGTILKDKDFNPKQEDGTKVASQALHQTEYILPNTYFPHFITVDNITPELFVHLLSCVLNQHRYGAQTTTTANNLNNHLVAVGFSDFEKPINSYTVSKAWHTANSAGSMPKKGTELPTLDSVKGLIQEEMKWHYGNSLLSTVAPPKGDAAADPSNTSMQKSVDGLLKWLDGLWADYETVRLETDAEKREAALKSNPLYGIYLNAKSSVDGYLKDIKMVSDGAKKKGRTSQKS